MVPCAPGWLQGGGSTDPSTGFDEPSRVAHRTQRDISNHWFMVKNITLKPDIRHAKRRHREGHGASRPALRAPRTPHPSALTPQPSPRTPHPSPRTPQPALLTHVHVATNPEASRPHTFGVSWQLHYIGKIDESLAIGNQTSRPLSSSEVGVGQEVPAPGHMASSPGNRPPSLAAFPQSPQCHAQG